MCAVFSACCYQLLLTHKKTLSLLIAFFLVAPAMAENTVTFGGSAHYPPFHAFDEQGNTIGFDIDIFNQVAALSGWQPVFRMGSWDTIQLALSVGEVDVAPMFVSEERSQRYLFSDPINVEHHLLFGLPDSAGFNGIESLSGFRVAAESGAFATREIQSQNDEVIIITADSEAAALDLVLAGEADYALLPAVVGWHTITEAGLDNLVAISPPLLPATYAFAISTARPELVSDINTAINQMQRSGILAELRQQWLAPTPETSIQAALRTAIWVVLPLALFAALALVGWLWSRDRLEKARSVARQHGERLRETVENTARLSSHDALTEFPNRRTFIHQMARRIADDRDSQRHFAVAIIGLHNLETIRDVMDDDASEELVGKFASVIRQRVPVYTGYLGSGQFAFLLEDVSDLHDAFEQVQNIIPAISRNITVGGMTINAQISGGLAAFPYHAQSEVQLIQQAKLAMSNAMRSGAQLLVFSDSMKPHPQKLQLMSDLEAVLAQDQLQWALQPQFCINAQRVTGYEMLVRWHHADYGWVSPGDFVVWAEQMGTIREITRAAIRQACLLMDQVGTDAEPFHLSVNLSANDLADSHMVEQIVESAAANAHKLTLEITETALMRDVKMVQRNVERLKQAGISLSLDDYGTGYSSLEYLKAFSFDEIKIDQMFISDMTRIDRNLKLTKASIELGHNLGARVVAEGVEDRETADMLIDMGCDVLQGYYIGRPQVPTDAAEYVRRAGQFRMTQAVDSP